MRRLTQWRFCAPCRATIAQGLIWAVMALGVFITFRLLDFADLTVDGSLATGGAVAGGAYPRGCAPHYRIGNFVYSRHAVRAYHRAFAYGAGHTGPLQYFNPISLYSINLGIMGKSNQAVNVDQYPLVASLRYVTGDTATKIGFFAFLIIGCLVIVALLYLFFGTELGGAIRATGATRIWRVHRALIPI